MVSENLSPLTIDHFLKMDGLTILGVTLLALVIIFAVLRVERKALWLVVLLLVAPAVVMVERWASLDNHWGETLIGVGLAAVMTVAWWLAGGRRLARPTSDNIKVWGQEPAPRLKASEAAALQSEVVRLREETERLEAEVRRLKSRNGEDEGGL